MSTGTLKNPGPGLPNGRLSATAASQQERPAGSSHSRYQLPSSSTPATTSGSAYPATCPDQAGLHAQRCSPDQLRAAGRQLPGHEVVQHLARQVQAALLLSEAIRGAGPLAVQDLAGQLQRGASEGGAAGHWLGRPEGKVRGETPARQRLQVRTTPPACLLSTRPKLAFSPPKPATHLTQCAFAVVLFLHRHDSAPIRLAQPIPKLGQLLGVCIMHMAGMLQLIEPGLLRA